MINLLFQHYLPKATHARLIETASPEPYDLEFYLFKDYDNNWFAVIEGTQLGDPQDCLRELKVALGVTPVGWHVRKEYHEQQGGLLSPESVTSRANREAVIYAAKTGDFSVPYALVKVRPDFAEASYGRH